jgi:hypothetical protein
MQTHSEILGIRRATVSINDPDHVLVECLPSSHLLRAYHRMLELDDQTDRRADVSYMFFTSIRIVGNLFLPSEWKPVFP